MPKKIKKNKELHLRNKKEKLINPDNVHILIILIAIIMVIIVASVGAYVYKKDQYHSHKDNAIVEFTYTEKLDEGYNIFSLMETDTKQIFTEFNSTGVQDYREISRGKYLDFNEEIYNSGIIENMSDIQAVPTDLNWGLYLRFADGTIKYISDPSLDVSGNKIDLSKLSDIIQKYFRQETRYK